jgi:AraC-like DNA-binding protein
MKGDGPGINGQRVALWLNSKPIRRRPCICRRRSRDAMHVVLFRLRVAKNRLHSVKVHSPRPQPLCSASQVVATAGRGQVMSYEPRVVSSAALTLLRSSPAITLCEISERLNLDRHTIERACRAVTGQTFRSLRARSRFEAGCELLIQHPPLSIKEVSARLGFGTPQSFARFIARMSGVPPADLRIHLARGAEGIIASPTEAIQSMGARATSVKRICASKAVIDGAGGTNGD